MASIFTKIINGDIPSYKVAETDEFYAFLDIASIRLTPCLELIGQVDLHMYVYPNS